MLYFYMQWLIFCDRYDVFFTGSYALLLLVVMVLITMRYTVNQEIHAALKSCGFSLKMIPRKSSVI